MINNAELNFMLPLLSYLLFFTPEPPSSLSICPQLCIPASLATFLLFPPSSSINSFPPIPHMCAPFSPHPHGDALQADNKCNLPSAAADEHRYLSLQHLQITPISLCSHSSILHFLILFFLFLCMLRPQWNEGLIKMNEASQLPYPTPIGFLRSCGGEFPWNASIPQSVLPDRFTESLFAH